MHQKDSDVKARRELSLWKEHAKIENFLFFFFQNYFFLCFSLWPLFTLNPPPCPTLPLSKARSKSLPKAERDEECPEDEENVNDGSELVVAQLPWREFGCEQVPKQLPYVTQVGTGLRYTGNYVPFDWINSVLQDTSVSLKQVLDEQYIMKNCGKPIPPKNGDEIVSRHLSLRRAFAHC